MCRRSCWRAELERDPRLRDRFARARLVQPPVVLGPLAIDVSDEAVAGLLLAGDAAGFIDPMTGDGLRFAVRGGVLAADAALEALAGGWSDVHARLDRRPAPGVQREVAIQPGLARAPSHRRQRSGRARSPRSVWPGLLQRIISAAGDCGVAALQELRV